MTGYNFLLSSLFATTVLTSVVHEIVGSAESLQFRDVLSEQSASVSTGSDSVLDIAADVTGYTLYTDQSLATVQVSADCKTQLMRPVRCDNYTLSFRSLDYRGSLNETLAAAVCDLNCKASLQRWFNGVDKFCNGSAIDGAPATKLGGYIWAGWNETCLRDPQSNKLCNDVIDSFPISKSQKDMDKKDACSYCYVQRLEIMRTPYSIYDDFYKSQLDEIHSICGLSGPTSIPPPLVTPDPVPAPVCGSNTFHVTKQGDSCSSVALQYNVSSAGVFASNQYLFNNCTNIPVGTRLCLPQSCRKVYSVQPKDTCASIEWAQTLDDGALRRFNSWIAFDCSNLQTGIVNLGNVVCLSPQGGEYTVPATLPTVSQGPRLGGGPTGGPAVPTTAKMRV